MPPRLVRALGAAAAAGVGDDLIDGTTEFLKSAAPRLSIMRRETDIGVVFDLPTPDGAQFAFSLLPGVPEISARLLPPHERRYFWYWPFRVEEYGSLARCEAEFFRCIGLILAFPTKIVQRRGLVSTRFTCHAIASDEEHQVGGSVGSFLSLAVPDICDRACTYTSPAVLAASAAADGRQDRA
jgi:hypothetical protein